VLKSKHQTEEEFQQEAEGTPLGFGAKPEEICAAVDFILSANSMTGETITLDGGQRLQSR
jgi:NAD(P)-dependent dehydrogenase (short-subunit alcohol dehydrogenase family)